MSEARTAPRGMNGFQAGADRLGARRGPGGFHSRATFGEGRWMDQVVPRAVTRAQEGDREAVRFLYLRYADNVYGYVRSIVRDDYEAEDVTQHVFAKLMIVIGRYEPRGVPFSAWILRLAHNVAIDYVRGRRAVPAGDVFGEDERAAESNEERARELRGALDALPDEQRDVIVLRHVVGLTPGEIAEQLGRSESSVHGLHHRGRRALRARLRQLELNPSTQMPAAA